MQVNICGRRYIDVYGGWYSAYKNVMDCFNDLGATINISPFINIQELPDYVTVGIQDSSDAFYVYNHTYLEDLERMESIFGKKTFIIKPTLPTPNHFTLDSRGYAAASSITYKKPTYTNYDSTEFFEIDVPNMLRDRPNKWSDRDWCGFKDSETLDLPDDHILLIGQLPLDEVCTRMSFGNNFAKLAGLVTQLEHSFDKLVIKLHPHLMEDPDSEENCFTDLIPKETYQEYIDMWREWGITVFTGYESLYDILPKTKVAIVENSTSGFECLMMQVPVISFGKPEYHWATQPLEHAYILPSLIDDMSWYDKKNANSFTAWYFKEYLCCDKESTMKRIIEILAE